MKNKVLQILRTFSKEELRKFDQFLRSPYFSHSKKVYKLFCVLRKFYPEYKDPKLSYEYLHKKISPHLKFNYKTVGRVIMDLEKLANEFIVYDKVKSYENFWNDILRNEFIAKSLDKQFFKAVSIREKQLEKNRIIDEIYFTEKSDIENDKQLFNYLNKKISTKKDVKSIVSNLTEKNKYFFLSIIIKSVKQFLNMKVFELSYNLENISCGLQELLDKAFFNTKLKKFRKFWLLKQHNYNLIYGIYYLIFKTFSDFENDNYYFKLKKLILQNSNFFNNVEMYSFLIALTNYCGMKQNNGKDVMILNKEMFSLYKIILAKKYYLEEKNSYFRNGLYYNILLIGLALKENLWVENFVQNYSNKLHPSYKANMKNFAYAQLSVANKKYEEALDYINRIHFDNLGLKLEIKELLLIIHYELNNINTLKSLLLSHKVFIKKTSLLIQERRKQILEFLNFLDELVKVKDMNKGANIIATKQKLLVIKSLHKEWLIEKADELMKKKYI